MTLQTTEAECAANAVAPRVSLADIEAAILHRYDVDGHSAVTGGQSKAPVQLSLLSLCILYMRNGFMVVGKSAPASAANFDAELGKKLAYEDAVRQIWPMMGWALRDKLHAEKQA